MNIQRHFSRDSSRPVLDEGRAALLEKELLAKDAELKKAKVHQQHYFVYNSDRKKLDTISLSCKIETTISPEFSLVMNRRESCNKIL